MTNLLKLECAACSGTPQLNVNGAALCRACAHAMIDRECPAPPPKRAPTPPHVLALRREIGAEVIREHNAAKAARTAAASPAELIAT